MYRVAPLTAVTVTFAVLPVTFTVGVDGVKPVFRIDGGVGGAHTLAPILLDELEAALLPAEESIALLVSDADDESFDPAAASHFTRTAISNERDAPGANDPRLQVNVPAGASVQPAESTR